MWRTTDELGPAAHLLCTQRNSHCSGTTLRGEKHEFSQFRGRPGSSELSLPVSLSKSILRNATVMENKICFTTEDFTFLRAGEATSFVSRGALRRNFG